MRKQRRLTRLMMLLLSITILLVLIVGSSYVYARRSLPKITGTRSVSGLDGLVEVIRDADGVPHIYATTDQDAFFALGYVHAQDRLWQMEFQRRIGAGRLSEILGEATLDTDKFLRTLGTYRAAETVWPALNDKSKDALNAYVAGVNAWIKEDNPLPIEFLILGFTPEPWRVTDTLVWAKMMAWDLGGNYSLELLRLRLTQAIGPERTAQLLPAYPDHGPAILAASQVAPQAATRLLMIDTHLQTNFQLGGLNVGSNNWVISGALTESGLPLLANDPHLGTRIPSVWYLAELQGDTLHVVGATLVGAPVVIIGHNETIAWGVTNLGPDVQDLYIERINPENLNQYEVEGEWADMTIVEEPIWLKDEAEPLLWAARSTRHGPLISDIHGSVPFPLAMRWTALDPGDTSFDAFLSINYAQSWADFTTALRPYVAPSQNFVYADRTGNIGYYSPGHIPIRAQGEGLMPVPGWNSEYEWIGRIPFDALPHTYNPETGYIATANHRVVSDDYPYFITHDWSPPYRAERIAEMIETTSRGGRKLSMADMITMQADQQSIQARQLLPFLQQLRAQDARQTQALSYLSDWDGTTSRDSIAAAIYQAWFVYLGRAMFADDLKGKLYDDFADRKHPLFLANLLAGPDLAGPDNVWCDNFLTTPPESCADIALQALNEALDDLENRLGANMERWEWGTLHQTTYPHNPFSEVATLKWLFERQIANGGDTYTVNVGPVRFSDLYRQYHVPSYRQVIDLADWQNSVFMHTTGQSGHFLSAHYDDLIERHRNVEYLKMTFGREAVQGSILRLTPE